MINSFISVLIHKEGKENTKKFEFKIIKIIITSSITGDMFLLNRNGLCVTLTQFILESHNAYFCTDNKKVG